MELLRLEHITKNFGKGDGKVAALRDISLKIDEGELVAIIGKSGSGKSTLLNIIGSLMRSDGGEYYYKNNKMDLILNKQDIEKILKNADIIVPKKRNYYMVDHADFLLAVYDNNRKLRSGTGQTVNYALKQNLRIIFLHPDTAEIS